MRMSDGSVSLEDRTLTAAHNAVDEIILTAALAVCTPGSVPGFDEAMMHLFTTIVQVEGLLATTANAYPHREPECFQMYVDLGIARESTTLLLNECGITPLVVDL